MKGLDISFSQPSAQWWVDRRAEGFEVMVQNLWTGGFASNEGLLAVAATNLRNARLAGFRTAGYANASPPDWWSIHIQMGNIKANAGLEWKHINDLVIDAEIPGITQARVMELADGLEAVGKVCDVLYTARWFWVGHMGNTKEIAWRRFRLWSAHYDWNPDIDFGDNPYGPWSLAEVIGEQYQGSTNVAGGTIDLNTFKDSWMAPPEEDDMGMTDAEKLAMVKLRERVEALEVGRPRFVKKAGSPTQYLLSGGLLISVRSLELKRRLVALGYGSGLETLPDNDPVWKSPRIEFP